MQFLFEVIWICISIIFVNIDFVLTQLVTKAIRKRRMIIRMKLQGNFNQTLAFQNIDTNNDGILQKTEFDQANTRADLNGQCIFACGCLLLVVLVAAQ